MLNVHFKAWMQRSTRGLGLVAFLWAAPMMLPTDTLAQPALAAGAAQTAINDALSYIDANNPEKALESTRKALQLEPNRVEAHLLYIRLMTDLNQRSAVQTEYARMRDQKKDGLSLMLYGRTLEKTADMEATFKKALTLDPKLGWAHYCLATIYVQRKQIDQAIKSLEQGIKIQANFSQAMESLGMLYVGTGQLDKAIPHFEKVVTLTPDSAQAQFQLGSLLAKKGQHDKAAEHLNRALALAPNNPQILSNLAFVRFTQKQYAESLALYEKCLAIAPSHSEARLNKEVVARVMKGEIKHEAVVLMEKAMEARTPEEAIGRYRRVIETSPNFELPYLALGQLLAVSGKAAEAEKSFLKAVELNPAFVEGVRMLAEFYIVSGRPASAEPYLVKALQKSPKSPELHAALGVVYSSTNNPAKAEKSFTQAALLLPKELALPVNLNRIRAIAAQARFGDAAKELEAMIRAYPKYLPAIAELGNVYFALEDFDKARLQYKAVLKEQPDNKDIKALLKSVDEAQAEARAKSKDSMRARQILVKTPAEADQILQQLKAGAAFEAMALSKSISPEARSGGDIGYFKKGELLPELEAAIVALKPGQISGVVKTSRGYHILKRVH